MTNDEFMEREEFEIDDPAILAVSSQAWYLYDDSRTHRLTGRWRITDEERDTVSRWILFLHSEIPYAWPPPFFGITLLKYLFRYLVTFGAAARERQKVLDEAGDPEVWPFVSRADYEHALQHPKLLTRNA